MSGVNSAAPSPQIPSIQLVARLTMLCSVRTALEDVYTIAKHHRSLYITSSVRKNSAQCHALNSAHAGADFGARKTSGVRRTRWIFFSLGWGSPMFRYLCKHHQHLYITININDMFALTSALRKHQLCVNITNQ